MGVMFIDYLLAARKKLSRVMTIRWWNFVHFVFGSGYFYLWPEQESQYEKANFEMCVEIVKIQSQNLPFLNLKIFSMSLSLCLPNHSSNPTITALLSLTTWSLSSPSPFDQSPYLPDP